MQAVSHTLAHRGPSASRARARWQPYSSVTLSSNVSAPSRASPISYLYTPASSISASPSTTFALPASETDRTKTASLPPPCVTPSRETSKHRYATSLVDQAVRSLCDSWHPDDIPAVFSIPSHGPSLATVERDGQALHTQHVLVSGRNVQLPSPISPSTRPSPLPTVPDFETSRQFPISSANKSQLLPIKTFVHEVLRRSRTSTGVLQTALCYLEAVRRKVPEVLRKEKEKTANGDVTDAEVAEERIIISYDDLVDATGLSESDTVRVCDDIEMLATPQSLAQEDISDAQAGRPLTSRPQSISSLSPLPPLPSPLLCPRRTFLACLILASKFLQDRSYSNRAWAKLAGLAPREIGRCERALGDALEWRLWVGKDIHVSENRSGRTVARSKSDGNLMRRTAFYPPVVPPVRSWPCMGTSAATSNFAPNATIVTPRPPPQVGLRRYATVSDMQGGPVHAVCGNTPTWLRDPVVLGSESNITGVDQFYAEPEGMCDARVEAATYIPTPALTYSPFSTSSTSSDGVDEGIAPPTYRGLPTPSSTSYAPSYLPAFSADWEDKFQLSIPACSRIPNISDGLTLAALNPASSNCSHYALPPLSVALSQGGM